MLLVNVGQGKSLHCPQLCSPRPMEHKRIAHSAQNLCADAVSAWQSKPQQAKCFAFINQSPIPFIFFDYTYICRKSNCRKITAYCKCIAVPHISQNEGGELT